MCRTRDIASRHTSESYDIPMYSKKTLADATDGQSGVFRSTVGRGHCGLLQKREFARYDLMT